MGILVERAIDDPKEDILDRKLFSKNLAKQLTEYKGNQCLTIGLIGEWGSAGAQIRRLAEEWRFL